MNYWYGCSRGFFYGCYYEQLKGNYLKALDEIYQAIEFAKKCENYSQLAKCYGQLATLLNKFSDSKSIENIKVFLK